MATRVQFFSVFMGLVVAAVLAVHGEPLNDLRTRNVGYAPKVFTRVSNSESGSSAGAAWDSFKAAEGKPAVGHKYPHTDSFNPAPEELSKDFEYGSRFSDARTSFMASNGQPDAVSRAWFPDNDLYYPPAAKFARNFAGSSEFSDAGDNFGDESKPTLTQYPHNDLYDPPAANFAQNFAGSSFPDAGGSFGSKPYYPHNDLYDPPAIFAPNFEDSVSSDLGRRYHGKYPHNDLYDNGRSSVPDQTVNSVADSRPFGDVYTYDATQASSGAAASFSSSTRFDGRDATYDDATDLADDDDSPRSSTGNSTTLASSPSDGSLDGIIVDVPPAPVVPTTRVLDTGTSGPKVWRWPPEWIVHCPSQTECIVADENPSFLAVTHLGESRLFHIARSVVGANNTDDSLSLTTAWSGCGSGNPVDDCWRCDPDWALHRENLADCAIGFGRNALGGKNGKIYIVTSPRDDDVASPVPGTLRHAVTRVEPLWVTFAEDMTIRLKEELIITSFKTIDGRGAKVHIAGGAGLTLQYVSNVIIHGIHLHDIKSTGPARIMSSVVHVGDRGVADGDAISIFTAKNIWVDHCSLANAADGLIDAIRGSTAITISNNFFSNHDKVMLFGAHKNDIIDRTMQITVAYNTFGPGLVQRIPRVRFGVVHIVNNDYSAGWGIYAIGGSEDPTILSEGNYFDPANGPKQITKRINDGGGSFGGLSRWNWKSVGDLCTKGSYFTPSGFTSLAARAYAKAFSCTARPATVTLQLTKSAGPLGCQQGGRC